MSQIDDRAITRRDALRRLGAGGVALTLPSLLAACGGGGGSRSTSAGSRTGGSAGGAGSDAEIDNITWSLGSAPPTLDIATGFVSTGILAMVLGLEGLVSSGDDLTLKPLLAESWSQPDPLRYVYKLRSGVKFWDGSPLTVEDVAYSLGRHIDPKVSSQLGSYYINVKSIEATGSHEVTVHMKRPDPLFQYVPVFSYVTPKAFSERLGKKLGTPGSTVTTMGTGPFEITSFSTDSGVVVERNAGYWGEKPRVRKATLRFIANPQTNLLAMRSQQIDGYFELPLQQAEDWDRLDGVKTEYSPGLRVVYLSFDVSTPPWDDIHVRRAVAHAADRAGYVKAFLGGHGRPATALVAPEQWGGLASAGEVKQIYSRIPQYGFDLDAAKAELAKSAHAGGFSASIDYPNAEVSVGKALVSLSQALEGLGITLKVNEVTQNKWLAGIYGHKDLGLHFITLGPDYADPANFPAIVYPSANAVKNNFNTANFKNAQVDRLLEQQSKTTDKAKRAQAIGEVLRISGEQLPYFGLWWQDSSIALNDDYVFQGFNSLYYYQCWLSKVQASA